VLSIKRKTIEALTNLGLIEATNELRGLATIVNPRVLLSNGWYRLRGAPGGLPIPPSRLIYLVAGSYDIASFMRLGGLGARTICDTLSRNGLEITQLGPVLDFGCGCGRVIRHFSARRGVAFHGCDYNARLIHWCSTNLTFARFSTNHLAPPLSFADSTFGLVYALSVFTHLGQDLQAAWLDEMRRVGKPGGHLLITTHGESYLSRLSGEERARFHAAKLVVRREHLAGKNICTAFCSERYVRENLTRGCKVVDFIPQGAKGNPTQDLCLLRFHR
jgi:SAM-dependent methyltransferase